PAASADPYPTPYVAGLMDGRADAATSTPDITDVRKGWIEELADPEYAKGYTAGLRFDQDLKSLSGRRS
ncbi:hypothetical protein, partial [Streptomyces javensis]